MNRHLAYAALAAILSCQTFVMEAGIPVVNMGAPATSMMNAPTRTAADGLVINGTGQTATILVNGQNLSEQIKISATHGLSVYPTELPPDAKESNVEVTLVSTLPETDGMVIFRSGDYRYAVNVKGYGSALEEKDLSISPVYSGSDKKFSNGKSEGFNPGKDGYTVEFRANLKGRHHIDIYGVTPEGQSFKAYVEGEEMGLYHGTSKVAFGNPLTSKDGGKSQFYNNDGMAHTYRYAVTSDKRVFAYRDGIQVAALRSADYANQSEWAIENGDIVENLLHNPGFEGEWEERGDGVVDKIEGWHLDPLDQYNCTYNVINKELDNDLDYYNHVAKLQRYNWNDGWGAGSMSQIVDVAPNSTYSLSFLASAGSDQKTGQLQGQVFIQEVQDSRLGNSVDITNEGELKPYGLTYTTSADCKQLKVMLYNERFTNGGGWGSNPPAFLVDEMVLSGSSRILDQKVGYDLTGSGLEYFTYDTTGAFAPVAPVMEADVTELELNGYGTSQTIRINIANLLGDGTVKLTTTPGFSVSPDLLTSTGDVTVTLCSTMPETMGQLILRSGDMRSYIDLYGTHEGLETKDLSSNPIYNDAKDRTFSHGATDGFTAGENGYTMEFKVQIRSDRNTFNAYAVTPDGAAFKAYVESNSIGLYNGSDKISFPNPFTAADGGKSQFYNADGKSHTYRFAVTPDKRVFAYRDGLLVATLRADDYANQPEWAIENGDLKENLLKNPGFEGEWNTRADGLVDRVEGWTLNPMDQYNCQYSVINKELDKDLDYNNHVMKLQRYNWNDGWGAGTVSQIVDVAPNSTYSLSFLAAAGNDSKTGQLQGQVFIQEVQDTRLGNSVDITNEGDLKPYGLTYTTSADCNQVKVMLYNERFTNGGGWGSNPPAFLVDEMVLSGTSRVLDRKVGFDMAGMNANLLEYFTYDATGAYAPLTPGFGDDFISGVETIIGNSRETAKITGEGVAITGTRANSTVVVSDLLGNTVAYKQNYPEGSTIPLPSHGVYLCTIHFGNNSKTIKIAY